MSFLCLSVLPLGLRTPLLSADRVQATAVVETAPQNVPQVMLAGVAIIGEKQLATLMDAASSEVIVLTKGEIHPSGLELVEIVDTAFGGNRVRVRSSGVEWWLTFAAPAALATQVALKQTAGAAHATAAAAPAQNLGTFSNDQLSKRFETPSSKRKAMARYPLPPGI